MHITSVRHAAAALLLGCLLIAPTSASALEVGDPAPPLTFTDLIQAPDDADVSWEALEGQAVVLEFWHTRCSPCVVAIPHMNEVITTLRDGGVPVQLISVTIENRLTLGRFLDERPMEGWIGVDPDRAMMEAYEAHSQPHTVLIDPEGNIAAITRPLAVNADVLRQLAQGQPIEIPEHAGGSRPGLEPGASGEVTERFVLRETAYPHGFGMSTSNTAITATNASAVQLLAWAHDTPESRIVWTADQAQGRYDLIAADPADPDGFRDSCCLRIAELLGLDVRIETQQVAVYVLRLGKRGDEQLTPARDTSMSSAQLGVGNYKITNQPLGSLCRILEDYYGRPVVDETGVEGTFDFVIRWDPSSRGKLLKKLRTRYGLSLTEEMHQVEMFFVE